MKKIIVQLLICTLFLMSCTSKRGDKIKPNIIFLMLDDCSAVEFSCYATNEHPSGCQTPVIDALAKQGLQFTTCWASPLCKPTRAMLLTGKYGCNTGVYGNKLGKTVEHFAEVHVPMSKMFQDNGYETAISGKWHLPGYAAQEAYGWDTYSLLGGYVHETEKEFVWDGLWFSWKKASHTFPDTAVIGNNNGKYPALYWHGAVIEDGILLPSDSNTFAPDLNQQFVLDYVNKEREKPFFLYYPIVLPHDPWFGVPDTANIGQRTAPGFANMIKRTEYYLAEVVAALKEAGVYENTIVFLTGDNATLANGKGTCSEFGVRVPLIVFGGALSVKGTTDVMVDFTDIYPTLMDCAGIDYSMVEGLDGKSFFPVLKGEKFQEKEYIFSFLDMERTVRNKEYMMDGSGGIWKCATSGNLLDYEPLEENEEAEAIRAKFMGYISQYPIPTEEVFGKKRIKGATRDYKQWPMHNPTTMQAVKAQDSWMHNERRKQE